MTCAPCVVTGLLGGPAEHSSGLGLVLAGDISHADKAHADPGR